MSRALENKPSECIAEQEQLKSKYLTYERDIIEKYYRKRENKDTQIEWREQIESVEEKRLNWNWFDEVKIAAAFNTTETNVWKFYLSLRPCRRGHLGPVSILKHRI